MLTCTHLIPHICYQIFFMMSRLFLVILVAAIVTNTNSQPVFIKDSIENYIHQGMKDWQIPGLAIVIVKDGKTVLMKGYGVEDIETQKPVDENTLFMIASNSKLFTGTALAHLDYHHKISLDDKITKYFPDFKLYEETTTELVTVRDMLSHHLGTQTFQGDFTFWNSNLSRGGIMNKMQLLQPTGSFRQSYGYCNSCFLTAGEVILAATKIPWEVYVYDSILLPLGMNQSHMLGNNMKAMQHAASPYSNSFNQKLQKLPYDNIDNLAPAGSMVSCVKDMAKWLQLQIDSGRFAGKQILPWEVLKQTREMQNILRSRKSTTIPSNFMGYGLGVFMLDYAGRQVYWHTGGADGFVTNTCFVPEENLGIAILTNNDNQRFFELLRLQILEAYFNLPYKNWSKQNLHNFLEDMEKVYKNIDAMAARIKGNSPPDNMNAYTGNYSNQLYGNISLIGDGKKIKIKFEGHDGLFGYLDYMDNGEWRITFNNPAFGIFPVKFDKENAKVTGIDIKVADFIEYDAYHFTKDE